MKSLMNGVEFTLDEKLLATLFHLNNTEKAISGEVTKETLEGSMMLANVEEMVHMPKLW